MTFFEETNEEAIRKLYEVNVFGTMRITRAVLPVMRQQRSGHVFNIASTAAYAPGPVIYHSSKAAVTGFSMALAFEVEPFGIKVTNVAPGVFRTGFYDANRWGTQADTHIDDYECLPLADRSGGRVPEKAAAGRSRKAGTGHSGCR